MDAGHFIARESLSTTMAASTRSAQHALRALRASSTRPYTSFVCRAYSSAAEPDLKSTLESVIPEKRELLKQVKSHADKKIGEINVGMVIGGMRTMKSMVWEGSVLDADEGIRFHGKTIADCQKELPKGTSGTEMLPEAMFWLLLTGQVPSVSQVRALSRELAEKSELPKHVSNMLRAFDKNVHPMTQLSCAVAALNSESLFAKKYAEGLNKAAYWEPTFEDSINLLAKLPRVAAAIFDKAAIDMPIDKDQDWAYNFATLLGKPGKDNEGFQDLLRLYLALHGDHEGGNVSAHATHLVGSALSDPYLSYAAGLLGLAGPLHGLAAQEVLRWILKMKDTIGENFSDKDVSEYLWATLKSGQVVPGYGHGVLRKPDPRFKALIDFGDARPDIANNPVYRLVKKNSEIAPGVLTEHGKTKNPHPNVDSASGVLFHHYGFQDPLYYTVTFGVSRGLGPLAQLIWDRALGMPIERPKSIDLKGLMKLV
ncbi:citrate synthase [Exophiala xenobiotica]|uniref:Citrate synthase n=1 Tax=Vermiconidia calcicola TaxID=1690605 RepID=A0AAV9Q5S5_9PEZI|nr:citrate synthase [Exophiala xenobiotica]KAK5536602.1 citrate synthase [Vermiconidia calcicola]KAK5272442.1 citrate synthase [Exophiala xenobiotica]KAK5291983.1 citrate synthase [Exophiala xenobiotica]KAK5306144.1 citrate synthase [Exophiala xenobiotica]